MEDTAGRFDNRFEGLEKDPVFLRKRRGTIAVFSIRMFLLGAEYAIILPSIWLYLKKFHVGTWFLGIVVAMYPIGGIIAMPVVGRLFDKFKKTREIILVLNGFEILGNILYALPYSEWLPLVGRFVAGLGDGFYSVANSEIVFTYRSSERTGIFALMEVGRVLGLILGPALNFFLQNLNFKIGTWTIDYGTSPALLMALFWTLEQLLTVFYVSSLSRTIEERTRYYPNIQLDTKKAPTVYSIDNKRIRETSLCESVLDVDVSDMEPLIKKGRHSFISYQTIDEEHDSEEHQSEYSHKAGDDVRNEPKSSLRYILSQMCCIEIGVLFYSDLVLWLAQTEFEVLLPLVSQEDYGWGESYLSLIYMVGGVYLVFVFLMMYKVGSKFKVTNQTYVIASEILTTTALILLICEQVVDEKAIRTRVAVFVVICLFVFSAIPLNLVAIKALVTSITPKEAQGTTQGVYSSISRAALVAGPVLASAAFRNRVLFGSIMAVSCLAALIIFVLCVRRIKRKIALIEEQS